MPDFNPILNSHFLLLYFILYTAENLSIPNYPRTPRFHSSISLCPSLYLKSLSLLSVKLLEEAREKPSLILLISKGISTIYSINKLGLMEDPKDHSLSFLLEKVELLGPIIYLNLEGWELEVQAYCGAEWEFLAWKYLWHCRRTTPGSP